MARLPRGMELVNPRLEGTDLVYDLKIAWWRRALLVLKAMGGIKVKAK